MGIPWVYKKNIEDLSISIYEIIQFKKKDIKVLRFLVLLLRVKDS